MDRPETIGRIKAGLAPCLQLADASFSDPPGADCSPPHGTELKARLLAGTLPPHMEAMLWYYAFGKPPDEVELTLAEREDVPAFVFPSDGTTGVNVT